MSLESNLKTWWDSSGPVTRLVTGGLWRDEVPELDANDATVEMPFARFSILSETPTVILTRTPNEAREYLEEQLLQVDIFAQDPAIARKARDVAKDLLDKWQPTLEPPDVFISVDRSNAALLKESDEQDGSNVWHAVLEYVVTIQRETNG